jgi:pectate lyase
MKIFFGFLKTMVITACFLSTTEIYAQTLAFQGAEGFGAYSKGGRGGDVYHVTNINDNGPGSLRFGIYSAAGPRTIVFDVSGIIQLESPLVVNKDNITIAGQTAPGDGICLRDYNFSISANNVIVRYIRSRLGDETGEQVDAISINSGKNIIVDHCSASWSVDEVLSCSTGERNKIDSVTVQWCIISEGLNNSKHHKGSHGYGSLIRGCYGAHYSYLHNLYAHNANRNPRPGNYDQNSFDRDSLGLEFDFRNNVMYNWGHNRPSYDGDSKSVCRYNYVNNYGKPGPNSEPTGYAYSPGSKYFKAYFSGNYFYGRIPSDQSTLLDWKDWSDSDKEAYMQRAPFSTGPVKTLTAEEAYSSIINTCGASLVRDAVDSRIINNVQNGTGSIINSQNQVGGWPELKSLTTPRDTDRDGMPDSWEKQNELNLDDPKDRNGDLNGDGYTNLEEYLNQLVLKVKYEK